jgi:hypothetical protein
MTTQNGYAGSILFVDLSTGKSAVRSIVEYGTIKKHIIT